MRALTALLIKDERPGHYHLSEGIVAAARRLCPVEVVRMTVRRRWPGRILAMLTNAGMPPRSLLRLAYGLEAASVPSADFIVSAGAETLTASVAVRRLTGRPNIFYGSLRLFRPEDFALVLTSYARNASLPRHAMILKPSAMDIRAQAPVQPRRGRASGAIASAALLLGGDSGDCRYASAEWDDLIAFVAASHARLGTRWSIGNSRRTPDSVSDALSRRVEQGVPAIARFIDVRTAGPGTLGLVLEGAGAVLCTDDSSSMISECVSAGLPVVGVRPRRQRLSDHEQGYRRYLADRGWYRSIAIAGLTPERLVAELSSIQPMTEDPLDRLAALLEERLPELFAATRTAGAN